MALTRYGRSWPVEKWNSANPDLMIELIAFRDGLTTEQGGLGRYQHFQNVLAKVAPWFQNNPWSDQMFRSMCENQNNIFTGCAAAGKTTAAAVFGFIYWLCCPIGTSVILSSTTGKMVRKRCWPIVQQCYRDFRGCPGNMVDSKTTLQTDKGDDKNGIFGIAVADGPTDKAVANIKGVHNKRMMLIIDEGTDTPEAIYEVITNLQKGCSDFRLVVIGNATSRLDPHGRLSEPKTGWNSISVESDEWDIAGVAKWGIDTGVALHFDGEKSPNLKLGEDRWPFIFTSKDLERARSFPDAHETIGYWRETRGFWPPEGICHTVFSESLILKHDGKGKHTFLSQKTPIAACDFAFGGDKCKLKFADLGDLTGGRTGLQLTDGIVIPIKATEKEPVHYQIAHRIIKECTARGVQPQHFAGDATGEGGGVMSILMQEWSDKVQWVEFGGAPSTMPVSLDDPRPASEVYDRKVTELWYSCRELLQAGQLKGLDNDECIQFCSREFEVKKRKIFLDPKDVVKLKIGHSPDDADTVAILVELARRLGLSTGTSKPRSTVISWRLQIQKHNTVYANANYESE
jgi:hypothetical protein